MIDKRFAHDQVMRLKSIDTWLDHDNNKGVIDELVLALMAAATEPIALFVITEWIERMPKLPTPADLRAMVWAENEKRQADEQREEEAKPARHHCAECNDSGIVESIAPGNLASVANYCRCGAGYRRRSRIATDANSPDAVNAAREKLRAHFKSADPFRSIARRAQADRRMEPRVMQPAVERDAYQGEF